MDKGRDGEMVAWTLFVHICVYVCVYIGMDG